MTPKNTPPATSRATRPENSADFAEFADVAKLSTKRLVAACQEEPAIRRVIRASARLAEMLTDTDRAMAKAAVTDALKATNRMYNRGDDCLDEFPDHKTRLAAATLLFAYAEGLPVKREVVLTGGIRSADEVVSLLQGSPEARRAMAALSGLGLRLESGAEPIELSDSDVQNSGE